MAPVANTHEGQYSIAKSTKRDLPRITDGILSMQESTNIESTTFKEKGQASKGKHLAAADALNLNKPTILTLPWSQKPALPEDHDLSLI